MDSNYKLSEAEQQSLEGARRLLGSNPSDYLLSGLGETRVTYRRAFTARGSSRDRENVSYRFELITEAEQGLPVGRDPLVLAALLDLLWKYQSLNDTIRFQESEVIERLDWSQGGESKSWVKRALERYLQTALCVVDPTITEDDRVFVRYARFRRLLVGYEITMVGMRVTSDRGQLQLTFLPEFIECLVSDAKRFLGVEFQSLRGMREINC